MKKAIKIYSSLFLLHSTLNAFSSPLQQSENSIAKEKGTDATYTTYNLTEQSANAIKDSIVPMERDTSFMQINTKLRAAAVRLKKITATLDEYVTANGFNTELCFMVDMAIPSGKNRFFVYNIKEGAVEQSSLVSHGSGSYKPGCNDLLVFSNVLNSNATSLGRYKIGNAYYGKYGLSYKLFGLDSTNSKAFERAIVLHSDSYVPRVETYPRHIYESLGCPAVSPTFLADLDKYIKTSKKPILLWIYN